MRFTISTLAFTATLGLTFLMGVTAGPSLSSSTDSTLAKCTCTQDADGLVSCVGIHPTCHVGRSIDTRSPLRASGCSCASDGQGNKVCVGDNARECLRRRELVERATSDWSRLASQCTCKISDPIVNGFCAGSNSMGGPCFKKRTYEAELLGCHTEEVPKCRRALGLEERAGCHCKGDGKGNTVCVGDNALQCLNQRRSLDETVALAELEGRVRRSCHTPEVPKCAADLAAFEARNLQTRCSCKGDGKGNAVCVGADAGSCIKSARTLKDESGMEKRKCHFEEAGQCVKDWSLVPRAGCNCRGDGGGNWVCVGANAYECVVRIQ
jgi:hypothetical protein